LKEEAKLTLLLRADFYQILALGQLLLIGVSCCSLAFLAAPPNGASQSISTSNQIVEWSSALQRYSQM
jgi:hypothetical protein